MQPKSETVLQVNNKIIFLCLAAAQKEYYDKKRNRRTQPGNGELNCSLLYLYFCFNAPKQATKQPHGQEQTLEWLMQIMKF